MTQRTLFDQYVEPVEPEPKFTIVKHRIRKKGSVPCLYCGKPSNDGLCNACWEGGDDE